MCRFSTKIVLEIVYGPQVAADVDQYIELQEQKNAMLGEIGATSLLDLIPIRKLALYCLYRVVCLRAS